MIIKEKRKEKKRKSNFIDSILSDKSRLCVRERENDRYGSFEDNHQYSIINKLSNNQVNIFE